MSTLYLFAPENDMALAFGGRYYTPTPVAQGIARDLSQLPLWYAGDKEAMVWSLQEVDSKRQALLDALNITAQCVVEPPSATSCCEPWGWSAYIVDKMTRNGVSPRLLPTDEEIAMMRQLSGRATSRTIMEALQQVIPHFPMPPLPCALYSGDEVERYVTSQPATMLKAPWSSSGRGVWAVHGVYDRMTARSAEGIIRKQGYIMGETWQEKVADMAMEFYSDGHEVRWAGYSLFDTDGRGAYQGNILASNEGIEKRLSQWIDSHTLHDVRKALESVLTRMIAPHYKGYLGIDMIVYRTAQGEYLLHPCIELNLRMSMGMVARIIADRYLSPASQGSYHVAYYATTEQLQEHDAHFTQEHALKVSQGRIVSGYIALTPILPDTHYCAYIVVNEPL